MTFFFHGASSAPHSLSYRCTAAYRRGKRRGRPRVLSLRVAELFRGRIENPVGERAPTRIFRSGCAPRMHETSTRADGSTPTAPLGADISAGAASRAQTLARGFAEFPSKIFCHRLSESCHVYPGPQRLSSDHSGAMSSAFTLSATSVGVARTKPPTGASRRGRVATVTRAACPDDDQRPRRGAPGRREALHPPRLRRSPAARANAAEPLKESFYDYTVSQRKPFDLSRSRATSPSS